MEDLKRRILKIVTNCNKPKVSLDSERCGRTFLCPESNLAVSDAAVLCVAVPHPAAGVLVRAVRRGPGRFPHRDGQQEGGAAQPAAAGGGVAGDPPLVVLSEPGVGRLPRPRGRALAALPAGAHTVHHGGRAVAEVGLCTPRLTIILVID